MEHIGKKIFWNIVLVVSDNGLKIKYIIKIIDRANTGYKYFFLNLSFNEYAITPKQRVSNRKITDLLMSSPQFNTSLL